MFEKEVEHLGTAIHETGEVLKVLEVRESDYVLLHNVVIILAGIRASMEALKDVNAY